MDTKDKKNLSQPDHSFVSVVSCVLIERFSQLKMEWF